MAQKRITITAKDIKDNNLVDCSWLHVLEFFLDKEMGQGVVNAGYKDLRTIVECLDGLVIYSDSITSITLLVTINNNFNFTDIAVDGLVY